MPHVLFLEDDPDRIAPLSEVARASGFTVDVAADLQTARLMFERTSPDIVLVDPASPNVHDVNLLKSLSWQASRPIPVIALPSMASLDWRLQLMRALMLAKTQFSPPGMPHETTSAAPVRDGEGALTFAPGTPLAQVERQLILATLAANGGVRGKTASLLGISPKTLYNKLKQFGTPV